MGLKILLVPLSILISLAIIVGLIRPDYRALQEKRGTYATRLAESENMDMIIANIDTLVATLDGQPKTERFVTEYLPKYMDQGRVIDMLNFLASRSGVAIVIMTLAEVTSEALPEATSGETIMPGVTVGATEGALVPPPAVPTVQPKTFSAQVTVKGRYENIKEFFQRVTHMNRIHKTQYFSLAQEKQKDVAVEGEEGETGILIGDFSAHFDYLAVRPHQSALYDPTFLQGSFDMGPFETTSRWVTDTVPLLEKPQTGRPNPFQ